MEDGLEKGFERLEGSYSCDELETAHFLAQKDVHHNINVIILSFFLSILDFSYICLKQLQNVSFPDVRNDEELKFLVDHFVDISDNFV
jgi:hypothetical protein